LGRSGLAGISDNPRKENKEIVREFMERIEKIREYLRPYIVEQTQEKIRKAQLTEGKGLLFTVKNLLEQAWEVQKSDYGWKPAYLALLHLKAGLLAETDEFLILLANREFYLDESRKENYWNPDFWEKTTEEERKVRQELRKKFIQLNQYEISYAMHWVQYECRSIVGVYWKQHLQEILKLEEYRRICKEKPFVFLFGDYMGHLSISLKSEGEV
jgi:hypothetical protein